MKKYDRETKKWIQEEEINKKLAKAKMCKGGREHDWILCLPSYAKTDSVLGLDKVAEYYKIEDEREDMNIALDEKLEAIGIKTMLFHSRFFRGRARHYICSVCLKKKYE